NLSTHTPAITPLSTTTPTGFRLVANNQTAVQSLQARQIQNLSQIRTAVERPATANGVAGASSLKLPPVAPRIRPAGTSPTSFDVRGLPNGGANGLFATVRPYVNPG